MLLRFKVNQNMQIFKQAKSAFYFGFLGSNSPLGLVVFATQWQSFVTSILKVTIWSKKSKNIKNRKYTNKWKLKEKKEKLR